MEHPLFGAAGCSHPHWVLPPKVFYWVVGQRGSADLHVASASEAGPLRSHPCRTFLLPLLWENRCSTGAAPAVRESQLWSDCLTGPQMSEEMLTEVLAVMSLYGLSVSHTQPLCLPVHHTCLVTVTKARDHPSQKQRG